MPEPEKVTIYAPPCHPTITGRCGATLEGFSEGAPSICALSAGHPGWHHGDDGCEWNAHEPVAELDTMQAGLSAEQHIRYLAAKLYHSYGKWTLAEHVAWIRDGGVPDA